MIIASTNTITDLLIDATQGLMSFRPKFWERGVGETNASGTGSCAVLVANIIRCGIDLIDRDDYRVEVFPTNPICNEAGGAQDVSWSEENNHVYLNECQPSYRFIADAELYIPEYDGIILPEIRAKAKASTILCS